MLSGQAQTLTASAILRIIGRDHELLARDMRDRESELSEAVAAGRFLVIGGAGSIGHATVRELFRRSPRALHVVDINENGMAETVRDLRSSLGYIEGDYRTFVLDCDSPEFDAFLRAEGPYDYVLNLSALKHVRSERDPFTLMRMLRTNVLNTEKTLQQAKEMGARKYFAVSTDKATNPVNMMGASKRIMELLLMRASSDQTVSTARFANVAFSDGSILHSFIQRLSKCQPIPVPTGVMRYFITPRESGEFCLLSCLLGQNNDVFFPKVEFEKYRVDLKDIALRFLNEAGYAPVVCASEAEARERVTALASQREWPCYFSPSDTTGEKRVEEFHAADDLVDLSRFESIGVIQSKAIPDCNPLDHFLESVRQILRRGHWTKHELVDLVGGTVPEFRHLETGLHLDDKM